MRNSARMKDFSFAQIRDVKVLTVDYNQELQAIIIKNYMIISRIEMSFYQEYNIMSVLIITAPRIHYPLKCEYF